MNKKSNSLYWTVIKRYLLLLCIISFILGLGLPILLIDQLNTLHIGGIPFGFWYATQGVLVVFVLILFVHNRIMNHFEASYKEE